MPLHSESYGHGHPLIILHGLFGSLENWRTLSKTCSQSFQVFALDQRNHGRSLHSEVFNYRVMVEDLREFLQQQGLSSTHLLGHSMGGKAAMQFAITYPQKVDKLVVVDIAPRAYPPEHDDIFAALFSLEVQDLRSRQQADIALARKIPDLSLRQFLLKNLEREASGGFRWRINLDAIYKSYAEILKGLEGTGQFRHPALFIRGGNSGYIHPEDEPTIKAIFPQAQLVTIPRTGHWVHAEAPQEFASIVLNFLAG
ncbi:MAG TPA: alpha/beta fold hydrolase [Candidatus Binatia bacterium]|jgi:pimeloyl-ACP methyl ester carboxylesterase|nr:alpha/beta fold hydrolase [Candidatus Binatia bacterium]